MNTFWAKYARYYLAAVILRSEMHTVRCKNTNNKAKIDNPTLCKDQCYANLLLSN